MTVPLFFLGFPVDAVKVVGPLTSLYAIVIHSNVNVSARWLNYLFNSPRFHAWHHALDAKDGGVNFAGFFPLFDALFGTYKLPGHLPDAYGIDDAEMPEICAAQLVYPFRSLEGAPNPSPDAIHADEELSAPLHSEPLAGL
jgi:sterol desaturase/sphingolipid hydroxylase (fatty acid hydroxylase superfamily)